MGNPSPGDPLGQRDPEDNFSRGLEKMIDDRIKFVTRPRTINRFHDVTEAELALELIARGWVVYRPREPNNS